MTNIEKELRREVRSLSLALKFQAQTIRLLAERIPPQPSLSARKAAEDLRAQATRIIAGSAHRSALRSIGQFMLDKADEIDGVKPRG